MNCKDLKQKLSRKLYCKKLKKEIKISDCSNCKSKEYKTHTCSKVKPKTQKPIKMRSNKQSKLERNRFSILTSDLDHCVICRAKKEHLHEVCFGRNRINSIKYGLVIPLCSLHHTEMHRNKEWQEYWHKKGQQAFIAYYPDLDFFKIFKINYL